MLDKATALKDEIIRLRRDIHAHPELSFQEVRTAQLVADTLAEIGIENVRTGVGRTGVVAQIGSGEGPTIGIRGDMDALPIQEAVDLPFASEVPGVMHACGHDAHTAMLLGVAHLLQQSYVEEGEKWQGNVRLLFQPSEEAFDANGISGATAMLTDDAMVGVDKVIALHVASMETSPARCISTTSTAWPQSIVSRSGFVPPAAMAPIPTRAPIRSICSAPSCRRSTASRRGASIRWSSV